MAQDHNGGNIQNAILMEEHDGINNAKRVNLVTALSSTIDSVALGEGTSGIGYVTTSRVVLSYYNQSSLVSGYVFHGFTTPGSNPTTPNFRIQREALRTKEVLFASGMPNFVNTWSAVSLASINYL
jgi:hypothetical protein